MEGLLFQVNSSQGGVPKRPLAAAQVTRDGVAGDHQADRRYHGGPNQALCLFDLDQILRLNAEGFPVHPGSLGENFTTRSVDFGAIRVGDTFRTQGGVEFQVTKPREPCMTIAIYGPGIIKRLWGPTVPWGESGFYARVVCEGSVRPGDAIRLVAPGPTPPPATQQRIRLSAAASSPGFKQVTEV